MRMWGVPPQYLCLQHLLGEHLEMHMFAGAINKNKTITGYLNGLVVVSQIKQRHDDLANELLARNKNHNSPLPDFHYTGSDGRINMWENVSVLMSRCLHCGQRLINFIGKDSYERLTELDRQVQIF